MILSMTPIADMVQQMLEKGVAGDAIVIAIRGAEIAMSANLSTRHPPDTSVDVAAERRRAWDREYRKSKRASTRRPPDIHPNPPDNLPLSKGDTTNVIDSSGLQIEVATKRRPPDIHPTKSAQRGARLADGWRPTDADWAIACELLGEAKASREIDKFKDHWRQQPGARGVKLDWAATWRNWVRRSSEFSPARNGHNGSNSGNSVAEIARREAERFENQARNNREGYPDALFRLPAR